MNDPGDPGAPLQGLLGDLLKMLGSAPGGTGAWVDAARSLAHSVATDGETETNPDPLVRIAFEELARVAELHVSEATGLPSAGRLSFVPVSRGTWALRALDAYRPLIEDLVALAVPPPGAPTPSGLDLPVGLGDQSTGAGFQELLGRVAATMGPVIVGLQFGSATGHLARRALGQYALPVPWPRSDELLVVPENVAVFASDWSLPTEEAELWVCVRELTTHLVLSRPHVAVRLLELLDEAASESAAAQQAIADKLGAEGDALDLQQFLSDPEALLADLLTPGERATSAQLAALTSALGGYVDHVTAGIAARLTGSAPALTEAWYRYRITEAKGEQGAGALFGLDLSREQVDRGAAFVRGVVERAGEEGLARLWSDARALPTPPEVDAPGLWLERIDLPDMGGPDELEA